MILKETNHVKTDLGFEPHIIGKSSFPSKEIFKYKSGNIHSTDIDRKVS